MLLHILQTLTEIPIMYAALFLMTWFKWKAPL